jgi:murein DD-endopeptidase MepM/ murein hydrolase activator NlpD
VKKVRPKVKKVKKARKRRAFALMPKFNAFLRIGLLFLLAFCVSVLFFPVKAAAIKSGEQPEPENGAGGQWYPVDTQAELASGTSITAEPEEFSKPKMLLYTSYTIQKGDTVSEIAQKFALNQGTLISINAISNTRALQPGGILRIPNQDGVLHKGKRGDALESIAKRYDKVSATDIQAANEIFSDTIMENISLFVPGAKIDQSALQEINGDLFLWPVRGTISDTYGYRYDPFTGASREFHNGMDISARSGTRINAAMPGRITSVVYDHPSYGNYVVITHSGGYRTLYAHMSVIRVKSGVYVNGGDQIGDVGSTGRSTGPHLHFTVYKNGVTVNPRALLK